MTSVVLDATGAQASVPLPQNGPHQPHTTGQGQEQEDQEQHVGAAAEELAAVACLQVRRQNNARQVDAASPRSAASLQNVPAAEAAAAAAAAAAASERASE